MHIPDGLLSAPVFVPLIGVTAAGVAFASARARRDLEDRPGVLPLTGVLGAFIFAAQMVNFPVPVGGVSGHLLGGVLAGILLGPYLATIAMTAVFILQAALLGDGGILALGANILNMGLIATFLGYGLYRAIRGALPEPHGLRAGAFAAGFAAVVAGSLAAYVEIVVSRPQFRGTGFLAAMVTYHAVIGLFEGAITVGVLDYVRRRRPDLVAVKAEAEGPRWRLVAEMAVATAVIAILAYAGLSSERPDGLEGSLERAGHLEPGSK